MHPARPALAPQWSGERLRGAPVHLILPLLAVEATAVATCVSALVEAHVRSDQWRSFAVLLVSCVLFEEISRQVGKLRLMVRTGPLADMTSVWMFAGVVVLPAGLAGALAAAVAAAHWLCQKRGAGQLPYRFIYTAATVVLASLLSSSAFSAASHLHAMPNSLQHVLAFCLAAAVFTLTNRLLIVLAIVLSGAPLDGSLLGRREDAALELATLVLGSMMSTVLQSVPLWAPLVVLPMALLQRGALVAQLEEVAATDVKTKLLNAMAWQQVADRELTALRHEGAAGAVLIIDLDHFKDVNDRLGHLVGDAALVCVGDNLKRVLRQNDVVGRFGGEEFVALLPRIDVRTALLIAERVRACIRAVAQSEFCPAEVGTEVMARPLSASIGVATFPDHGNEVDDLLRAADAALYVAKRAGRDRVALAGAGPDQRVSSAL
jgi:diguanylate cyclase (GGDEF)-like protein